MIKDGLIQMNVRDSKWGNDEFFKNTLKNFTKNKQCFQQIYPQAELYSVWVCKFL